MKMATTLTTMIMMLAIAQGEFVGCDNDAGGDGDDGEQGYTCND